MNKNLIIEIFESLVQSGKIESFLSNVALPNIPFPTMGGRVFWNNISSCNGWRLQRNGMTGHCRILDPNDVRRAWGSMSAMENLFSKFEK